MRCVYRQIGSKPNARQFECMRCGHTTIFTEVHPMDQNRRCLKPGIGDCVKAFFAVLGIKACEGCESRRVWLNDLHVWWYRTIWRADQWR